MITDNYSTIYNTGNVVLVRPDLNTHTRYYMKNVMYGIGANTEMQKLCGMPVTIREIVIGNNGIPSRYRINEDNGIWYWTDDMFCGIERDIPDDFDCSIENFYGIG